MIGLLIGIVASIPIGIAINLITPSIKTKYALRSAAKRDQRIMELQLDYLAVHQMREGGLSNQLIARSAAWLMSALGYATCAVIGLVLAIIVKANSAPPSALSLGPRMLTALPAIVSTVSLILLNYTSIGASRFFDYVAHRDERYKTTIERSLLKLGSALPDPSESLQDAENSTD